MGFVWIQSGFAFAQGCLFSEWGCAISEVLVLRFRTFLVDVSVWICCGFRKLSCTVSEWVLCIVRLGLLWFQNCFVWFQSGFVRFQREFVGFQNGFVVVSKLFCCGFRLGLCGFRGGFIVLPCCVDLDRVCCCFRSASSRFRMVSRGFMGVCVAFAD